MTETPSDPALDAGDPVGALEWLVNRVKVHDDRIVEHSEQIARLQGGKRDDADADDGAETEEALQKYVDHLIADFAMRSEIRTTWKENPAVVQELDALRRLRDFVYSKESSAYDRVTYHDAVERVRERLSRHHARRQKDTAVGGSPRG